MVRKRRPLLQGQICQSCKIPVLRGSGEPVVIVYGSGYQDRLAAISELFRDDRGDRCSYPKTEVSSLCRFNSIAIPVSFACLNGHSSFCRFGIRVCNFVNNDFNSTGRYVATVHNRDLNVTVGNVQYGSSVRDVSPLRNVKSLFSRFCSTPCGSGGSNRSLGLDDSLTRQGKAALSLKVEFSNRVCNSAADVCRASGKTVGSIVNAVSGVNDLPIWAVLLWEF